MGRHKKDAGSKPEKVIETMEVKTDLPEAIEQETPAIPEGETGSEGQEIVNATDSILNEDKLKSHAIDEAYYMGKQIMPGSVHEVVLTKKTYIRFTVEGGVEYTLTPDEYNSDVVVQ